MLNHIVIFTAQLDFNVRWNVMALATTFPHCHFTIVVQVPQKTFPQLIRNQFRNLRRHGWRWIPYQGAELAMRTVARGVSPGMRNAHRPGQMFEMEVLERHPRIEIHPVANINGQQACDLVRRRQPDLGIALAAPILKNVLFSIPRLGTLNLHKGRLPDYRGMPPAFWELKNRESHVGCTVHRVESGLDTGDILVSGSVPVDRFSTVAGMQLKLHRLGVELVCEAVERIASGRAEFVKQSHGGKTYTRPSLAIEHALARQLSRAAPSGSVLKGIIKKAVFGVYAHLLRPPANWVNGVRGRQRVIILLYHRVSDAFRDSVTVGIEQFDRQMAYIAAHCHLISLQQIVQGEIPRHSLKPIIAVSFDDGYLDNYENAAPILLKHQVPCTFFVSTGKIAANAPFEHDLKALGFGLPNMRYAHLVQMHQWGFHFGSHTINHVNLAAVSDDVAMHELSESFNDIRGLLGKDDILIAYPYGRKHHINAERIRMIKELGYAACFSAYGGYNGPEINLFDVRRTGINWTFDMAAFKSRLHGWDNTV